MVNKQVYSPVQERLCNVCAPSLKSKCFERGGEVKPFWTLLAGPFCVIDKSAATGSQIRAWPMQPTVGSASPRCLPSHQRFWTGRSVPVEGARRDPAGSWEQQQPLASPDTHLPGPGRVPKHLQLSSVFVGVGWNQ